MFHEYFWDRPMWFFPIFMPVIWIIVILIVLYLVFWRRLNQRPWEFDQGKPSETALDILKKRYAKGEISKEEFEQMKRDILS